MIIKKENIKKKILRVLLLALLEKNYLKSVIFNSWSWLIFMFLIFIFLPDQILSLETLFSDQLRVDPRGILDIYIKFIPSRYPGHLYKIHSLAVSWTFI